MTRILRALCLGLALLVPWTPAVIDEITLELVPPNLLITGGFVDVQWTVKQSNNPQPFELTFFREGPCGTNQSLLTGLPPSPVSSGPHVVALCDGDRVENKIFVIGREVTNSVLVPGSPTLEILSDTVPPDPPNIDDATNDFPKTVFTATFQITGNVDNSNPAGNATDKPETAGSVTVFIDGAADPVTGQLTRQVLGGGLIQPTSRFIGTVDITTLAVGQTAKLRIVATDSLGHESAIKDLGDVTRGLGGDVRVVETEIVPAKDSLTAHTGVLIKGRVLGTVAPFKVKFFVNEQLNSEIAGLASGDAFSHSLNMTSEGQHCFSIVPENTNTPIFKGTRVDLGCINLDLTPPPAPQILIPNPSTTLITKGPEVEVRGLTEADKNLANTLKPKLFLTGPSGIDFSPLSPLEVTTSGNFSFRADIQNLPDGQHAIEIRAVDEVGNTDPSSEARVSFIKDSVSPIVEEVRVNNVIVPQLNPPVFLSSQAVRLRIRLNEDSESAPTLVVRPFQDSQFNAGLFQGSGKVWEYSFAVTSGQDGPLGISVTGGGDRAGNTINFSLDAIVQVDTRPPSVKEMIPPERSVLSKTPEKFRLLFEDIPPSQDQPVSLVDTTSASIKIFDPNGTEQVLKLVEFDPVTVDAIPVSPFTVEGDYRIEIIISDKAGNRSLKDTRLFTMDFSKIREDRITCLPLNNGFARSGVDPFLGSEDHFVQVQVQDDQFDVQASSLILQNFQEIPQVLPGEKRIIDANTMRYALKTALPSDSSKDGKYVIESQIFDFPGNHTEDHICVFTYDNCSPSVLSVFPENGGTVARNLRTVSAVLKDCQPRFDVEISDIDVSKSSIRLFQVQEGSLIEVSSKIRFESVPNQRATKILLEIVDSQGIASSLPNDGSADGTYRVEVVALDRSGNSSEVLSSTFVLDTLDPIIVAGNLQDDQVLAGGDYFLFGKSRDNTGGSGLEKLEIKVEAVEGLIPTTTLLPLTPVLLTRPTLPPNDPSPPFQDWTFTLRLNVTRNTNGLITLRAHDRAGNYRDYSYRVRLIANTFNVPEKSIPVNNSSTSRFFVDFAWSPVDEARGYELEIITPNQNRKTFQVVDPRTTINLAALAEGEGIYGWNVSALDSQGNLGLKTLNTNFRIDQTPPKITSIQIQDPSPESQGRITQGITRLLFVFSEEMKTSKLPRVFLRSVEPGVVTTIPASILSFQHDRLLAQVKLDSPGEESPDLRGFVRVVLEGAHDPAGNKASPVDSGLSLFEVQTGPFFDLKFFSNPVDRDALTLAVKGFTEPGGNSLQIPDIPSVILLNASDEQIALNPIRVTDSAFSVSMHLSQARNRDFRLQISGEDRFGNIATRFLFFPLTQIFPEKRAVLSSSRIRLEIPSKSVEQREEFVLAPADTLSTPPHPGLSLVETLPSVPNPIKLKRQTSVRVRVEPKELAKGPLGLFVYTPEGWSLVEPGGKSDGEFLYGSSHWIGPMAVFRDQSPPRVQEADSNSTTNRLSYIVEDEGSGISSLNSYLLAGSRRIAGHWNADQKLLEFSRSQLPPRVDSAQLIVEDRLGNRTEYAISQLGSAPAPKLEAWIVPNPVRQSLNLRIRTNYLCEVAEMYVYDARGNRVFRESWTPSSIEEERNWDLISQSGAFIRNGVYFLKLRMGSGGSRLIKTLKFAVLSP
jgi:hypothetical protein